MPIDEESKAKDARYIDYLNQGYSFWNSYTVKPEVDRAVEKLKHWGSKVKVIQYPNGVYVVLEKGPGATAPRNKL